MSTWTRRRGLAVLGACWLGACSDGGSSGDDGPTDGGTDPTSDSDTGSSGSDTSTDSTDTDGETKFDVMPEADIDDPPPESCKVIDDMDALPPCMDKAPPDSFEPDVQWEWSVPPEDSDEKDAVVTPLVANLTDDNDDGEIDLCDVPDIVVLGGDLTGGAIGRLYVLDGETGSVHYKTDAGPRINVVPALGDIDGDGISEILFENNGLVAYEHDLTPKWSASVTLPQGAAVALADLDADGDVEIIAGQGVWDHEGNELWLRDDQGESYLIPSPVASDLDDDGDLEVTFGRSAFHHDGSVYYDHPSIGPGFPQVADFDDDDLPEVLIVNKFGLTMLEHDGTVIYQDENPTNVNVGGGGFGPWLRPAAVHDFNGDDLAEFAVSSLDKYGVFEADTTPNWLAPVLDASGRASGTAFDFLGDGLAEAIYADETKLFVFDETGQPLLTVDRVSPTQIEYPIVADVDNDQSAEIVVVSSAYSSHPNLEPVTVKVIRDVEDRWIGARRIWNQHTYHVTNVREDGTIPQDEPKHWQLLNTFRTQAQLEGGGVCKPEPEG